MRIAASTVSLSSTQTDVKSSSQFTYLKKWDKKSESIESSHFKNDIKILYSKEILDRVEINPELLQKSQLNKSDAPSRNNQLLDEFMDDFYGDFKLQLFKELVEKFTGTEIKVFHPGKELNQSENATNETDTSSSPPSSSGEPVPQGWGIDYFYQEINYVKEGFSVEAAGKVYTDKGIEINFNTSLSMSRETYNELTVSIKAGDALIDPLVVDFTGSGTKLSNEKFNFDLNIDGIIDSISSPARGSGFLAYDKNGDGIINDGSELFGPSTNNGFSELASYDDDNNGWIDENDAIFSNLSIWEKYSNGTGKLSGLLDKNVGAIYTGHVNTTFNLPDTTNKLAGSIKQTGLWLNEKTGKAGIIQEIDLVL